MTSETTRVVMLRTETGRWPGFFAGTGQYHCRKDQTYDVPTALARAWVERSNPVAKRVRTAPKRRERPRTQEPETVPEQQQEGGDA